MPSYNAPTDYQTFIALAMYSRWDDTKKKRETWEETVERWYAFWVKRINKIAAETPLDDSAKEELLQKLAKAKVCVLAQEVMPSMRTLTSAGKALETHSLSGFNCAHVSISIPKAFDELLYASLCGTGVGYSVESKYTNQLPEVPTLYQTDTTIVVADSKIGWASSLRELITLLYVGKIPKWDLSKLRPAGARLKTSGGRSSGPAPLAEVFQFVIKTFKDAQGRKLKPIECHDICCVIGQAVVVGGCRRSALLSMSDVDDDEMQHAKHGRWYDDFPYRSLANNSAVFYKKPNCAEFMKEWIGLYRSKSGERGIINMEGIRKHSPDRRDRNKIVGMNPCVEANLRNGSCCNLTSAIVRATDTALDILQKVEIASFIGTLQSTLTDFKYLSKKWKENCDEERLLGVSLSGIMDNLLLHNVNQPNADLPNLLETLKREAVETNEYYADILKINHSAAVTCVKPDGNTSQLVDSSPGIHPRFSKYYLRTVRRDKKDPLSILLKQQGVCHEDDITRPKDTDVLYFPIKSPDGSVFRKDVTAIQQLDLWLIYKKYWCEHNPSTTIYVREDEWIEVGAWVYRNWDYVGGLSFLPYSDHIYRQAPYQEITESEYNDAVEKFPSLDFTKLSDIENEDGTTGSKELACSGGMCET
jgi:ribonucleoside-diphosphate reductase alpha chain